MRPCECRGCDPSPCPCPLATVLDEWSGDKDFTNNRDVTQMPGWTRELEHNRDSNVLGYLWRIVGRDWRLPKYLDGEFPPEVERFPDGQVVALGPVRDFRLYGSKFSNANLADDVVTAISWLRTSWCEIPVTRYYSGSPNPFFSEGFSYLNSGVWYWHGYYDYALGSLFPLGPLANYQLQLGVIRCDCKNGLYITWPNANPESQPATPFLLRLLDDGKDSSGVQVRPKLQELRIPGSPISGAFGLKVGVCSFGAVVGDVEYIFDITATATEIQSWIRQQTALGVDLSNVVCTGGPLPAESILISVPVDPNWSLCVYADLSKVHYTMVGHESRWMTRCEQDARAWSGDIYDNRVPVACPVDAISDGKLLDGIFTRWGRVSPSAFINRPPGGYRQLDFSDLSSCRILFLRFATGYAAIAASSVAPEDLAPIGDLSSAVSAWLALGGRTLVLDGACAINTGAEWANAFRSRDMLPAGSTESACRIPANSLNSLLAAIGSSMSVQNMWTGSSSPIAWGGSIINNAFGSPEIVRETQAVPAGSSHSLQQGASSISQTARILSPPVNGSSVAIILDATTPAANLLVINGGTPLMLWSKVRYEDSRGTFLETVQPFTALAVEDLANGSRILLSGAPGSLRDDPLNMPGPNLLPAIELIDLLPAAWLRSWMMS